MNETVKIWLEDLINKEIDEVLDDIESRKTWCLEISDKEVLQILLDRLCLDNAYLTALKALKNRIEREKTANSIEKSSREASIEFREIRCSEEK